MWLIATDREVTHWMTCPDTFYFALACFCGGESVRDGSKQRVAADWVGRYFRPILFTRQGTDLSAVQRVYTSVHGRV